MLRVYYAKLNTKLFNFYQIGNSVLHGQEKRSRREKEKKGQTHGSRKERPEVRRDAKEARREVPEVRREVPEVRKEVPEVQETQAALFARDWEDTMHRARRTQGRNNK
jgi:hypothetical protein